jgi:hypothetical protein
VVAASCYEYPHHRQGLGSSLGGIKRNRIELSTDKILEENLAWSAFQQTDCTFQQDNNLKNKDKNTLEFLSKKTLNVPEWPSYSLDLNRLKSMALHENGCLAMINNQLDRA